MNDQKIVEQFVDFLVTHGVVGEFDDGIAAVTAGTSTVQFAMSDDVRPEDYIIEAFGLGAIPEQHAHRWNQLSDLWREVLNG